jgi:acyl-CoA reductase-like NAD-dependent aldehyde dehydrogenase
MWIEGAGVAGDGAVEVVRSPATEEPLAEVWSASPAQVDAAVETARAALPGWRRLVEETRRLRLGDPLAATTDVGPMVAEVQRARVERMELLQTETFGPVAPVQRVGSLDEAIARANALPYGLGANVYTHRLDNALRCMEELEVGTVWINDPPKGLAHYQDHGIPEGDQVGRHGNARATLTDNDAGPFGGMKMSGNARELGPEGLESFRETRHVHLDGRAERKPWWYPYGQES